MGTKWKGISMFHGVGFNSSRGICFQCYALLLAHCTPFHCKREGGQRVEEESFISEPTAPAYFPLDAALRSELLSVLSMCEAVTETRVVTMPAPATLADLRVDSA